MVQNDYLKFYIWHYFSCWSKFSTILIKSDPPLMHININVMLYQGQMSDNSPYFERFEWKKNHKLTFLYGSLKS